MSFPPHGQSLVRKRKQKQKLAELKCASLVYSPGQLFMLLPPINNFPGGTFREENGNPLQYFLSENPMNRGAWWAAVSGVAKSQTKLSN